MDYAAEQEMELEALQAILMDDLQPLQGPIPDGWPPDLRCHSIAITADDAEPSSADRPDLQLEFVFAHTPTYPDEPPYFKARSVRGLSDSQLQQLHAILDEQIEANIGMGMIYAMVSAAQEWIRDLAIEEAGPEQIDPAEAKQRAAEEEERRLAEIRAQGTPVNMETFAAWRAKWDAEAALSQARLQADAATSASGLTGKQYFMQQDTIEEVAAVSESGEEDDDADYDDVDDDEEELEDDDEDDMLESYLASQK